MRMNTHKLTQEFCLTNELLFTPRNEAESVKIQKKLHDLGIPWVSSGNNILHDYDDAFKGIVVRDGRMYTRSERDHSDLLFCTLEQFDTGYEEPLLTREQQETLLQKFDQLTQMFTRLSAKVDMISDKVDAIHDQVMPTSLEKSRLKSSGGDNARKP